MGSLTGSVTAASTGSALNLTNEGVSDWKHWGRAGSASNIDRKSSGGNQISDGSTIGSGGTNAFSNNAQGETWSDGTPTLNLTESPGVGSGFYTPGLNNGFNFTVPADTTSRTLKFYGNLYGGNLGSGGVGTLVAHLSDSSASDYTNSSFLTAASGASALAQFTFVYSANSAGQTLTVTITVTTAGDTSTNVTKNSATLILTPESVGEMLATMQRTNTPVFQPIGILAY